MHVNIHYENEYVNLGLIRLLVSCDAKTLLQLLQKYLADVGTTNNHIYIYCLMVPWP